MINNDRYLGGFEFCGTNIAELKLGYSPENKDTYVYNTFDYDISEQSFPSHDGAYFFGTTLRPKIFNLRCIFEEEEIDAGFMARVDSFFYRGRTGKLIFERRPWAYYTATVVNVDYSQLYSRLNGVINIQLKAYYPYAMTDYTYISEPSYSASMEANSALFNTDINPPIEYTISGDTDILLYNGGTQRANVTIDIGGNIGGGLSIYNTTNGSQCAFMGMSSGDNTEYVELDGVTGNCYFVGGTFNGRPAFSKHNYGFITLDPAFPSSTKLHLTNSTEALSQIKTTDSFTQDMVGKYLCLTYVNQKGETCTNEWVQIVSVIDEHTAYVNANIASMSQETAPVMMNKLHIDTSPDGGEVWLKFNYRHTFA